MEMLEIDHYNRAKIQLETSEDVADFILALCDGTHNHYFVENFDGTERVNARSLMGMLYATGAFPTEMYLINTSGDKMPPSCIDQFRKM